MRERLSPFVEDRRLYAQDVAALPGNSAADFDRPLQRHGMAKTHADRGRDAAVAGVPGRMRHRLVEQRHDDAAVRDAAPSLILGREDDVRANAFTGAIEMHVHADRIRGAARKAVAVVERNAAHRPTLRRSTRYSGSLASRILRCTCSIGYSYRI